MHPLLRRTLCSPRRIAAAAVAGLGLSLACTPLVSPLALALIRPVTAAVAPRSAADTAKLEAAAEAGRLAAHIADTWKTPLPDSQRIVAAAFTQAEAQRVSPTLILAVVAQESGFRPTARSGYGAEGLMQVSARHHPEKLRGLRQGALLRPETNIRVGTVRNGARRICHVCCGAACEVSALRLHQSSEICCSAT